MYRSIAAATVLALASAVSAYAQSSDPAWLDQLQFEIRAAKRCEISYLIRVHEGRLGEKTTYEARVQCQDGHMYDASRTGEDAPFVFTQCERQVC